MRIDGYLDEGAAGDSREPASRGGGSRGRERRRTGAAEPLVAARPAARAASGAGLSAASKFLGRFAQLDLLTLGDAIHRWHRTVTEDGDAWFEAEDAVAQAVHDARRHPDQEILLRHMADLFLREPWFTAAQPGARIRAAEPAGQYVATLAMLAVLVRDRLDPQEFELLYRPFASVVPVSELERE